MSTTTPQPVPLEETTVPYNKTRLVIIHDTDADGIAAAWCIRYGFGSDHSEVLCIPQRAGINTIPEGLLETDTVFLVDRTYHWSVLLELAEKVFSITVLDHHKSAKDQYVKDAIESGLYELEDYDSDSETLKIDYANIYISMDVNHSACMLAWNYSQHNAIDLDPAITEAPWFIKYIEDRDMWWFRLSDSKAANAGIHHIGNTFDNYDSWVKCEQIGYNRDFIKPDFISTIKSIGKIVLDAQLNIIKGIAHGPTVMPGKLTVSVVPYTFKSEYLYVYLLCCPFTLISDLGDYMLNCEDPSYIRPDVIIVYNYLAGEDKYVYSIRSKQDMLWLAKLYGGGGHPQACGFTTSVDPQLLIYDISDRLHRPPATTPA